MNYGIIKDWRDVAYSQETDKKQLQKFWADYFLTGEGHLRAAACKSPDEAVSGTVKELAEKYET